MRVAETLWSDQMKVLWTHNFDPAKRNAGCFMHTAARGMEALGVEVQLEYLGNLRNPLGIAAARRRVRRLARGFDVAHAQYGSACALATVGCGVPSALYVRGSDWHPYSDTQLHPLWLHTRLAHGMTLGVLRRFGAITCVSERIAREVARCAQPCTEVVVLPSPIDLMRWPERSGPRAGRRPPHRVLFTSNSLANPIKRQGLLEAACEIASRQVGPIEVVRATGIDHEAMPALVASCDAVACTSETEGWPNSVKEALACGIPFVATDVSDLATIAQKEPSCRIAAADPKAFARGLCEVLTSPVKRGLRQHVAHMDLPDSSRKLKAVYERLLKI